MALPFPQRYAPPPQTERIPEEYDELCRSLQIMPVAMVRRKFEMTLCKLSQPIFLFQDIMRYLAEKAEGKQIVWMPLSQADWNSARIILACTCTEEFHREEILDAPLAFGKHPYSEVVPLEVLQRIQRIRADISTSEVPLFVSDYSVARPDPFVLALFGGQRPHVIVFDGWDEPGFFSFNAK